MHKSTITINAKYAENRPCLTFGNGLIYTSFGSLNTCRDVFNAYVTVFQSNCTKGLHFSTFLKNEGAESIDHNCGTASSVCIKRGGPSRK